MSFAKEGYVFIATAALIAVAAFALALNRRSWPLWLLAFVVLVVALWVAYFFRDPEREGERGESIVVAPADGKVVDVRDIDEPIYIKGRATRISIFMNVFSVHVNRYPVSGTVGYVRHTPGKFLNAAVEASSLENEQVSVGVEAGRNRVLVRQVAGLIARRIITYSKPGDRAEQGARFGLIRFGSRVDVFVPAGSAVRVKLGENTVAGTTVIAQLP